MVNEVISSAVATLSRGGVVLYPTDTLWGIGCDATLPQAVQRIFNIKKRNIEKSFVVLVADFQMLERYTELSSQLKDFLQIQPKPTSVVYENVQGIAPNACATDGSLAIRVVESGFCQALIAQYGRPLISTSANISGEPAPRSWEEIPLLIKQQMDYIVPASCADVCLGQPSQIVRFSPSFEPIFLRK